MQSVHNKKETVKSKQCYLLLCRFAAGQSEPVGTCEKQMKCRFSLSIPYEARLARACLAVKLHSIKCVFLQPLFYSSVFTFS